MTEDRSAHLFSEQELTILKGEINCLPKLQSNIIRIFLSSTFSDTKVERNALIKEVFPELKDYCKTKYQYQFQVVDMRWGIPREASELFDSSQLCLQEVADCQKVSAGPNFVAFIGDRYGSRPLLSQISAQEFDVIVRHVPGDDDDQSGVRAEHTDGDGNGNLSSVDMLQRWYRKDENAVPQVYNLMKPSEVDATEDEWTATEPILVDAIRSAVTVARDQSSEMMKGHAAKYFQSVTELEVHAGIKTIPDQNGRVLAFFREIDGADLKHDKAQAYFELSKDGSMDNDCQELLANLKELIRERVPSDRCVPLKVQWSDPHGISEESNAVYLKDFCNNFKGKLIEMIDHEASQPNEMSPSRLPEVVKETLVHSEMCSSRVKATVPREDIMEKIKQLVTDPSKTQQRPVVVFGPSGCGKTSIMAAVASRVCGWIGEDSFVFTRLLGTTLQSVSIEAVFSSLCQQLLSLKPEAELQMATDPDDAPMKSYKRFWLMLSRAAETGGKFSVILDSVDQLQDDEDTPFELQWLPSDIPSNVHVFLSTLREDIVTKGMSLELITPSYVVPVGGLSADLAWEIMTKWLGDSNRSLTPDQTESVKAAISNQPTALYVKMVFDRVRLWKSYSETEKLPENVSDAIDQLFSDLERKHGRVAVQRALGYVSLVKGGISELELEDILSLDETYLTAIFEFHVPPIRRVPSILWSRIRHDINEYVVEKEADGIPVIAWYHRQFIEKASERYNSKDASLELLAVAEDYFMGKWSGGKEKPFVYTAKQLNKLRLENPNAVANRYVPAQPTCFDISARSFNLRKLHVLSDLWVAHKMPRKVADYFLFDLEFLIGKLHCDPWPTVKSQLSASLQSLRDLVGDTPELYEFHLFLDMIMRNFLSLTFHPFTLGTFVYGALNRYCDVAPRLSKLRKLALTPSGLKYNAIFPTAPFIPDTDPSCIMSMLAVEAEDLDLVKWPGSGRQVLLCQLKSSLLAIDVLNNEEILKDSGKSYLLGTIELPDHQDVYIISMKKSSFVVISAAKEKQVMEFSTSLDMESSFIYFQKMKLFWNTSSAHPSLNDLCILLIGEEVVKIVSVKEQRVVLSVTEEHIYHANEYRTGGENFLAVVTSQRKLLYSWDTSGNEFLQSSESATDHGSPLCMYIRGSCKQPCTFDAYMGSSYCIHITTDRTCGIWKSARIPDIPLYITGARIPCRRYDCVVMTLSHPTMIRVTGRMGRYPIVMLYCSDTLEPLLAIPDGVGMPIFTPRGLMLRVRKTGDSSHVVISSLESDKTSNDEVSSVPTPLSCKDVASVSVDNGQVKHCITDDESFFLAYSGSGLKGWSVTKALKQSRKQMANSQRNGADEQEKKGDYIMNLKVHPRRQIVLIVYTSANVGIFDVPSNSLLRVLNLEHPSKPKACIDSAFWVGDTDILISYNETNFINPTICEGTYRYDWEGNLIQRQDIEKPLLASRAISLEPQKDNGRVLSYLKDKKFLVVYDKIAHTCHTYKPFQKEKSELRVHEIVPVPDHVAILGLKMKPDIHDKATVLSVYDLNTDTQLRGKDLMGTIDEIRSISYCHESQTIILCATVPSNEENLLKNPDVSESTAILTVNYESLDVNRFLERPGPWWTFVDQPVNANPLLLHLGRCFMSIEVGTSPEAALKLLSEWETSYNISYVSSDGYLLSTSLPNTLALTRASDGKRIGEAVIAKDIHKVRLTHDSSFAVVQCSKDIITFHVIDRDNVSYAHRLELVQSLASSDKVPSYDLTSFDAGAVSVWEDLIDRCETTDLSADYNCFLTPLAKNALESNLLMVNPDKIELPKLTPAAYKDIKPYDKFNVDYDECLYDTAVAYGSNGADEKEIEKGAEDMEKGAEGTEEGAEGITVESVSAPPMKKAVMKKGIKKGASYVALIPKPELYMNMSEQKKADTLQSLDDCLKDGQESECSVS